GVLARYPALSEQADIVLGEGELRTVFAAAGKMTLRESSSEQGWRIEAIRPLTGYPMAVAVSGGASAGLADWRRQVWDVGLSAIGGGLAIGLMMYLTSRQIHAHDELVAIRGDKLEAERARLEAETKLLKVERLAVLGHVTGAVARELRVPLNGLREALETLKGVLADSGSELERPLTRMGHSLAGDGRYAGRIRKGHHRADRHRSGPCRADGHRHGPRHRARKPGAYFRAAVQHEKLWHGARPLDREADRRSAWRDHPRRQRTRARDPRPRVPAARRRGIA